MRRSDPAGRPGLRGAVERLEHLQGQRPLSARAELEGGRRAAAQAEVGVPVSGRQERPGDRDRRPALRHQHGGRGLCVERQDGLRLLAPCGGRGDAHQRDGGRPAEGIAGAKRLVLFGLDQERCGARRRHRQAALEDHDRRPARRADDRLDHLLGRQDLRADLVWQRGLRPVARLGVLQIPRRGRRPGRGDRQGAVEALHHRDRPPIPSRSTAPARLSGGRPAAPSGRRRRSTPSAA